MNKENIPVITDREELYDKCENMEQLFDKYYLPLLDKHYSKIYELQQENQQLKEQLEASEKARKSGIDYLTSYESISTIQSLDNIEQNKGLDEKTMNEMIRRYSVVHDKVLKMLDIKDSDK